MSFSKKAKDPVCGMEINVNGSTLQSNYKGTDYYFCSADCLEKFDKEPETFVADASDCCGKGQHSEESGHQHGGHHHHSHCGNGHDHQHCCGGNHSHHRS